jgi:hypothetical protein
MVWRSIVVVRHEARVRVCVTDGSTERVMPLPVDDVPVDDAETSVAATAMLELADGSGC